MRNGTEFQNNFPYFYAKPKIYFCGATYDSLLNPFVMGVHEFTAQINGHLRSFDVGEQIVQRWTHNQSKFEFFFEEFRTDFGYGLLKESRRSNHIHHMDDAREEWLRKWEIKFNSIGSMWIDIGYAPRLSAEPLWLLSIDLFCDRWSNWILNPLLAIWKRRVCYARLWEIWDGTYGGTTVKYEINFS